MLMDPCSGAGRTLSTDLHFLVPRPGPAMTQHLQIALLVPSGTRLTLPSETLDTKPEIPMLLACFWVKDLAVA